MKWHKNKMAMSSLIFIFGEIGKQANI